MKPESTLIFTAVEMESRTVRAALNDLGCRFHTVGIRARHLPAADEMKDVSLIILCGVAGGLDPALQIGDIVLDDPAGLVNRPFQCRRGSIHSSNRIASTPQQKLELFHQTGALAVDMEQAAMRSFAGGLGIPLIGIRAISDTADQTLDPAVLSLVDDLGRPRPVQIAATLLRRPWLIPQLRRLDANTRFALKNLGIALRSILQP